MLEQSASLSCSFGLFGLSGLSRLIGLFCFVYLLNQTNRINQIDRYQSGLLPRVAPVAGSMAERTEGERGVIKWRAVDPGASQGKTESHTGIGIEGRDHLHDGGWLCRLALQVGTRGRLAVDLIRITWRFRSNNWYRQFPFLPLPDPTYLRWRMYTAYGDYDAVPSVTDVERYARWASVNE